ncbi:MAG TPA: DNA primase, partial [Allosphingosinicella sp.]
MTLSPQFLDELRARTTLSTLIGKTMKLQRAGREWKAPCPLHKEKSASFFVNDEKEFYHCFGCGAHGDAIRWLTDHRGIPFMEAVSELAAAAGMEMPARDPQSQARAERAATLYEVTGRAAAAFVGFLGYQGTPARLYLEHRSIDAHVVNTFSLGFAPDSRTAIRSALGDMGDEKLIEAGMLIRTDDGEPYDRFRNRIMFPIHDSRGRVIAFGGRILGKGEPKYLNSPDTPLFDKGRSLYNIHRAAPAARKSGRLIVVEGYMDVIALFRAGVEEAVAPNGTALTEAQMEIAWRLSDLPILCFDGDQAGRGAAARAAIRALPLLEPGRSLGFAFPPPGMDPDDVLREHGPAGVIGMFAFPLALTEMLWKHELQAKQVVTPEDRAGLLHRLRGHARTIRNAEVRDAYADWMKSRYQHHFEPRRPPPARPMLPYPANKFHARP